MPIGFPLAEQKSFLTALADFRARLDTASDTAPDVAWSHFLEPGNRWNDLINAVGTYVSGAELDRVSARDFSRYDDSGVNWRVVEGYGAVIATHGAGLPMVLGCPVRLIDHSELRLRVGRQRPAAAWLERAEATATSIRLRAERVLTRTRPGRLLEMAIDHARRAQAMLGLGHTTQDSLVGYRFEVLAGLDATVVSRPWGAVYARGDLRGVTVDVNPDLPRNRFMDASAEAGLLSLGDQLLGVVVAAGEHRFHCRPKWRVPLEDG